MATTTQTVIIDFQSDFSDVQDAVDILEKAGKVDTQLAASFRKANAEIQKQGQAFDKTAQSAGKETQTLSRLDQLMKQFPKSGLNRFLLQVGNELAKAGVNAKDFQNKLDPKDTVAKTQTLRQELKLVKDQMQAAALAGGVLSDEYIRLKERAGELDDTIKDVSADIANAGSDTRGLDNVVGSISAVAGAFSLAQGAAALFGDENEDIQKALLKVNAAMAIATGLQQVANATTKQGSLTRLADTAATYAQIAAQRIYTFVTGKSTAATVAFKVALAATGIGLVIVAVYALAKAFEKGTSDIDTATEAIERQNRALESMNLLLENTTNVQLALAEKNGKAESELIRIRGRSLQQQVKNLEESSRYLAQQRDSLTDVNAQIKLNNQIEENNTKIRQLNNDVVVTSINLETQLARERKEAADRAKELNEAALKAAKDLRLQEFEDFKAGVELKLLAAEKGSEQELAIKKQLLLAQLQIDLEGEKLTLNQRRLLIQQFFKDRAELQNSFNKSLVDAALEDDKSRLEAALENLNLNEEEKLAVKIDYLNIAAAQEIVSADGNAAKIKAINAKLQADITQAKIDAINKAAQEELRLTAANGGSARRALESVSANEKLKSDVRINAINQLRDIEIAAIDREIKANRDAAAIKGADQKELDIQYAELMDKKAAKTEETEAKITGIVTDENKKRQESTISYINATLQGLQQIGDIIAGIQANQQAVTEASISRQRDEIEQLLETGAITEKEAEKRRRKVDAEERAAKNKAAQQTKNLAVFNAFLQIPQAYIAGLTAPPPVGGPIYAAVLAGLAAVQASIIASRPVPRFATGKKGSYKGFGMVGDAGAELIERADGSMEVATKKTITYLGPKDKVFTAGETKRMMPFVNKEAINYDNKNREINYDKLAAAIIKGYKAPEGTQINIDKEFISESVANGLGKINYFDRYYSSK